MGDAFEHHRNGSSAHELEDDCSYQSFRTTVGSKGAKCADLDDLSIALQTVPRPLTASEIALVRALDKPSIRGIVQRLGDGVRERVEAVFTAVGKLAGGDVGDRVANLRRFGLAVRRRRVELRISQAALATSAQTHGPIISQIESGVYGAGPRMLLKISEALGLTVDELLARAAAETGEPSNEPRYLDAKITATADRRRRIAEWCRETRKAACMTQSELARQIAIPQSLLSLIESGGGAIGSKMLGKLESVLGTFGDGGSDDGEIETRSVVADRARDEQPHSADGIAVPPGWERFSVTDEQGRLVEGYRPIRRVE